MSQISRYLGCTGLAAIVVMLAASPAIAQTTPPPALADTPAEPVSGDIIVTAQKRSERLQDVPMAITALDTGNFSAQGITRVQDYLAQVPGLGAYSGSSGQVTLAIRGITTGGHNNPTVGITLDDIPLGSSVRGTYGDQLAPELDPAILQQIEVLRGPQGTLYGAASLGGLIRYVTVQPKFDAWSGRAELSGSTIEHGALGFGARGSVNVPIASNLAASVSGFFRRDAGFVDNPGLGLTNVDRTEVYGGRAALLWKPLDNVEVRLAALYSHVRANGVSDIDANANFVPLAPYAQSRIAGTGPYMKQLQFYTATVDADLGAVTLTSETAYERNSYVRSVDSDIATGSAVRANFGPGNGSTTVFRAPSFKISQELRLTSASGHAFEWLLGFYFNHEVGKPQSDKFATSLADGHVVGTYSLDSFPVHFTEYAGFANFTYHVSERFSVEGGFRYSWNSNAYHEVQSGFPFPNGYLFDSIAKDAAWTYAVSPSFKISHDLTVYARVSTGYRPGGPNALFVAGLPLAYHADTTKNYEAGFKGAFFDRMLTLSAAVYDIDWNNIQLQLKDAVSLQNYYTNAGRARSRGIELTAGLRPVHGLSITGNFSLSDATLREDLPTLPGSPKAGARLPYAPKWSGSVVADDQFAISGTIDGFVGATYNYVGSRTNGFTAIGTQTMPGYSTVDLRAGVQTGSVKLSFYVQNLTDKLGILAADARSLTASNAFSKVFALTTIRPRTVGVSIAKTF